MRRTTFGMFAASALLLSACGTGGGGGYPNKPRPAVPVNLTVYINDQKVSVSPNAVGAGPVVFIVTNAARRTESLTVSSPDGQQKLADTGPINPESTAEVTVDFEHPGDYPVNTGSSGGNQAQQATQSSVRGATLHVGKPRPHSSNTVLLP
jgi:hypothetical protein